MSLSLRESHVDDYDIHRYILGTDNDEEYSSSLYSLLPGYVFSMIISILNNTFAVASLAIQLLESVIKIHDFCKHRKNASEQLDNIVAALALLQRR